MEVSGLMGSMPSRLSYQPTMGTELSKLQERIANKDAGAITSNQAVYVPAGDLTIEVDTSLPSLRAIRVLERLLEFRGKPQSIRVDNGPEFISDKLKLWCEDKNIHLKSIQPG
jgi:hypothetical protein